MGSVAERLHGAKIESVIASRFPLTTSGSIQLTKSFYSRLINEPTSVEEAFRLSRNKLAESADSVDYKSLQLWSRGEHWDSRPLVVRPYRGLLPFELEHQRFFHGADKEVAEVLEDLQSLIRNKLPRLLIVAGSSGTGKSSVVRAGVVPKLRSQQPTWTEKIMRPGTEPSYWKNPEGSPSIRRNACC